MCRGQRAGQPAWLEKMRKGPGQRGGQERAGLGMRARGIHVCPGMFTEVERSWPRGTLSRWKVQAGGQGPAGLLLLQFRQLCPSGPRLTGNV